ncbi:hypothetical protein [Methylobacter sp.]|uniref:hypothetical protein n=1 Tax=Methylobacter sp. TaxID=2051955 RepID=UPI0011F63324|nr:hypothetical protein [Methylobacter sp.]TAK59560.1 MAG: hypothetical protein EPO18_20580 [Methylobacter sp.]
MSDFQDLERMLDSEAVQATKESSGAPVEVWEHEPVTFREFLTSSDHMAFPEYSARQYAVPDFMLGEDPKKIFDSDHWLAVLEWGKGSGKDTVSVHMVLYVEYVLMCLKNPQSLFPGISATDKIDCVNIAWSAGQANRVFFDKLKTAVLNWRWLKKTYKFKVSGKYSGPSDDYIWGDWVTINQNSVFFPKGIRAFSMHSQQESFEGLNPLLWVCDEFAAFQDKNKTHNADKIFETLKTSSESRFGSKFKGFLISFPRYKGDAIERYREQYEADLDVYTDIAMTWEVKPERCFSGKWAEYRNIRIPLEYLKSFEKDPETMLRMYCCVPGESDDPFFTEPERLDSCVGGVTPIIKSDDWVRDGKYVCKRIMSANFGVTQNRYAVIADLGLSGDPAALAIWHKERLYLPDGGFQDHLYQDFVTRWIPSKDKNLIVDINDIEAFITALSVHYKLPIDIVTADQWNSPQMLQSLEKKGFKTLTHRLTPQDHRDARVRLYSGNVHLIDDPAQILELKRLRRTKEDGSDHPPGEHNDYSVTTFAAIKILSDGDKKKVSSPDEGEMVESNIDMGGDGEVIEGGAGFSADNADGFSFRR